MSRSNALILSGILLLHAGLAYWGFGGYQSIDDYCYSKIAYAFSRPDVFTGDILYRELYLNRVTVWLPPALLLKIFPLNDVTLSLWPFLCSALTVALVFAIGARINRPTGAIGALLLAVNLEQLQYATTLVPDVIVSMLILLAGGLLFLGRRANAPVVHCSLGAALALVFSIALFAKETASWLVPLFVILFARDCLRRKNFRFWSAAAVMQIFCAALICGSYAVFTGDPLHRLRVVDDSLNVSVFSFAGSGGRAYLDRLTRQPLLLLLRDKGFAFVFALALLAAAAALFKAQLLPRRLRFWSGYFLALLLTFWFGSTSLKYYNPIQPDPRHLLCLLPPMCLLAGALLSAVFRLYEQPNHFSPWPARGAAILPLIPAMATLWQGAKIQPLTYGAFAGLIWLQSLKFRRAPLQQLLHGRLPACALLLLNALIPVYFIAIKGWFRYPDHRTEKRIVNEYLSRATAPTIVLTDFATAGYIQYHFRYRPPAPLKLQRWDDAAAVSRALQSGATVYVLFNRNRALHVEQVHRIPTPERIDELLRNRAPLLSENEVEWYLLGD